MVPPIAPYSVPSTGRTPGRGDERPRWRKEEERAQRHHEHIGERANAPHPSTAARTDSASGQIAQAKECQHGGGDDEQTKYAKRRRARNEAASRRHW